MKQKKKISVVVLGAGFAGIRCVQDLVRMSSANELEIILVDKNNYNLFRADLYEVATAFTQKKNEECLTTLRETIATPISKLINKNRVKFFCDRVEKISASDKRIFLEKKGPLSYDYLVVALGSVTNDYGIEGMKDFSYPLKKLADGIRVNCNLDFELRRFGNGEKGKEFNLVVCGGGATGVELSAELIGAVERLGRKYNFDSKKVHVRLVEGGSSLARFDSRGTKIVKKRLEELGVKIYLNHYIKRAEKNCVVLAKKEGDKLIDVVEPSDITIWSGGVRVPSVVRENLGSEKCKGGIEVDQFLQARGFKNIFAAGDNAYFVVENRQDCEVLPMVADVAIQQGRLIAKNILALVRKEKMRKFKWIPAHYYLPIGGRWALCKFGGKYRSGFLVWLMRRLVFLRYNMSILPFWSALRKWLHSGKVFRKND